MVGRSRTTIVRLMTFDAARIHTCDGGLLTAMMKGYLITPGAIAMLGGMHVCVAECMCVFVVFVQLRHPLC